MCRRFSLVGKDLLFNLFRDDGSCRYAMWLDAESFINYRCRHLALLILYLPHFEYKNKMFYYDNHVILELLDTDRVVRQIVLWILVYFSHLVKQIQCTVILAQSYHYTRLSATKHEFLQKWHEIIKLIGIMVKVPEEFVSCLLTLSRRGFHILITIT